MNKKDGNLFINIFSAITVVTFDIRFYEAFFQWKTSFDTLIWHLKKSILLLFCLYFIDHKFCRLVFFLIWRNIFCTKSSGHSFFQQLLHQLHRASIPPFSIRISSGIFLDYSKKQSAFDELYIECISSDETNEDLIWWALQKRIEELRLKQAVLQYWLKVLSSR